jgi:amino acid permease
VDERDGFFREAILNNLKLIAVLEFVSNAYTFSLWIELLLVPSLALIMMLKVVAESNAKTESKYKALDSLLGYILAFIGIVIITIAFYKAIYDHDQFVTIHNLRDFLLPVVLSVLYLPFVYVWALFLAYQYLFVRIDIHNRDKELARHLKKLVLVTFHVKLGRLLKWTRWTSSLHINDQEDATILVKQSGASE